MPSLTHQDVYDKALMRIDDIKLANMLEEDFYSSLNVWIHTFISRPKFRKIFKSFNIDDDVEVIDFVLKNPIDDDFDSEFVASILAKGLILSYFPMKLEQSSYLNAMVYGGDEKWKDNYKNAQVRLLTLEKEVDIELSQHTYYFGRYKE